MEKWTKRRIKHIKKVLYVHHAHAPLPYVKVKSSTIQYKQYNTLHFEV